MSAIKKLKDRYTELPVALKATIWFVFCSTIQKAISVLTTPIFTRLLSTDQYGLYSVYNTWLYVFTIITAFRLDCGVFNKAMSKYKDDRDGYTSAMQGTTVIITGIVLVIYLLFQDVINEITELSTFITLLMFLELFLTPAITFWTIRQRYEYRYRSVVFVTVGMSIGNAVLGVIAVLLTDVDAGVARIISCVAVQCCFGSAIFVLNLYKGKKFFSWEYAKYAILFNIPLMPHYMSTFILEQSDRIMIQKMISFSAAGIYSVAYSAGMIMKIITTSVTNAIIPWQYERLEKQEYRRLEDTLKPIIVIVAVILGGFITFAPEIMKLLASRDYYEAVYCIPPVATSVFFIFIYSVYNNIEFYFEENKYTMFIALFGAVLNIGLNYLLLPLIGYVAAAYTTLICYIVFTVLHNKYVQIISKRKIGREIMPIRNFALVCMMLVAGSVVMGTLYKHTIIRYGIAILLVILLIINRKNIMQTIKSVKG